MRFPDEPENGTLTELKFTVGARYKSIFGLRGGPILVGGEDPEGNTMILRVSGGEIKTDEIQGQGSIEAISGASADDLWAVGPAGVAYHFGGDTWIPTETGVNTRLRSVHVVGASVYAVGGAGTVLRYGCEPPPDASAASPVCAWPTALKLPGELYGIRADEERLMLATSTGIVEVQGSQSNTRWSAAATRFYDVWTGPDGVVFAVGADNVPAVQRALIVKCDSSSCSPVELAIVGALYAVYGVSETDVFAVGQDPANCGIMLHYDGTRWTQMVLPMCVMLRGVWGSSGTDVWAVGTVWSDGLTPDGQILHYDGREWTVGMQAPVGLVDIAGSDAEHVYAVGINENAPYAKSLFGTVLHFDGLAWSSISADMSVGYTSVFVERGGSVWLGALRWRDIEQDSVPEIRKMTGTEIVATVPCDKFRVEAIEGIGIGANSRVWAIGRGGALLNFMPP